MSGADRVQVSKTLSYLLRHQAVKEGLPIRPDGYVPVDAVLRHPSVSRQHVNLELLQSIVAHDSKQRYSLLAEQGVVYIRANQGHTLQLDEEQLLTEIRDPSLYPVVVHGTYMKAWDSIKRSGLNRMKRNHIHFAKGLIGDESVKSGMRSDCQVFVFVDISRAMADGIRFFESANGVVLTSGQNGILSPRYFQKVLDRHGRSISS